MAKFIVAKVKEKDSTRVIDVGCGKGYLTLELMQGLAD